VVDVVGDVTDEVAERVVGQLRHVHDGVEAAQVVDRQPADVLVDRVDGAVDASVEPAVLVEAGVDADDVMAVVEQVRTEQAAEVALAAREQDAHGSPGWAQSGRVRGGGACAARPSSPSTELHRDPTAG
jgi:hypothetical protein